MQSTDLGVKIGSRIRASRMSIGLTQEQLAEKVGVSWSTISSLERGMHMVSLERLLDICEALNSGLEIILEQNRCAMACQGCGIAIFCFL